MTLGPAAPYRDHPVVLLGGGYNALSAARSLGRAGCAVHVGLDAGGADYVAASRYVASSMRPGSSATAAAEWLAWVTGSLPAGTVVVPCSDPALELLARSRAELESAGLLPVEADDRLLLTLLDKELTYVRARALGVRTPRTHVVTDVRQGLEAAADLELPFAVKPRVSHRFLRSGTRTPKAVVVRTRRELEPALRLVVGQDLPVVLTEIVTGVDDEYVSYYGYLDDRGEPLLHVTKRKLRQYPVGFGTGTYHSMSDDPEVAELGQHLFDGLGLRGLGNVEFKRDTRGRLTLIECNLRLTGATELLLRAGVDVADLVYRRALGLRVAPLVGYDTTLRQWLPGHDLMALREYRRQGAVTTGAWLASTARPQTFPVLRSDDLRPSWVRATDQVRRATRSQALRVRGTAPRLAARALTAGIPAAGSGGKLARAALSEAGMLGGVGLSGYRQRWRGGYPVKAAAPGRADIYRTYWLEAAAVLGARVEELGGGLLRISLDGDATMVWDSVLPVDDPLALRVAGHKPTTRALLQSAGVPVGDQIECGPADLARAQAFLDARGPVVVKPAMSGGGSGVTCGVLTHDELTAAFAVALRSSERVVIEPVVTGQEFRLLVLDGTVISAVRRRPPWVEGDGRSTVAELVEAENARRRRDPSAAGLYPFTLDLDLALTLRRAGSALRAVPPRGVRVQVKTAVNENGPQDNDLVAPSPALVAAAERAARAVGVELAAVEIITPDPGMPLQAVGGCVVEINTTPGLHYHYQVTNPDRRHPVAVPVLQHLLRKAAGARPDLVLGDAASSVA